MKWSALALAIASVSLNAIAQVFWKKTMLSLQPQLEGHGFDMSSFLAIITNLWLLIGIVCYVISIGFWLIVLQHNEISVAYPLIAVGFVITTAIGYFYFGDNVSLNRLVGIGFILSGVIIVTRS